MIDVDLNHAHIPLDWRQLFGRPVPTDVEIGSGKGKFLNELAAAHPERNLLAVERSPKYHRLCCERAARRGLTNVRLIRTTGEDLVHRLLAPGSVATFFLLFPDPWPKKRHHKRRFVTAANVAALREALAPDGRLLVKSDHAGYAAEIDGVLSTAAGFEAVPIDDAFADLPVTGFEQKYIVEGRVIRSWALRKSSG